MHSIDSIGIGIKNVPVFLFFEKECTSSRPTPRRTSQKDY